MTLLPFAACSLASLPPLNLGGGNVGFPPLGDRGLNSAPSGMNSFSAAYGGGNVHSTTAGSNYGGAISGTSAGVPAPAVAGMASAAARGEEHGDSPCGPGIAPSQRDVGRECWAQLWTRAGCKPELVPPYEAWHANQSLEILLMDAHSWATLGDEKHRRGCYGDGGGGTAGGGVGSLSPRDQIMGGAGGGGGGKPSLVKWVGSTTEFQGWLAETGAAAASTGGKEAGAAQLRVLAVMFTSETCG